MMIVILPDAILSFLYCTIKNLIFLIQMLLRLGSNSKPNC